MTRMLAGTSQAVIAGAFLCASISGASAQTAVTDVRVSATRIGHLSSPAVATDANANFVVVWESPGLYGERAGIFARRFEGAGVPLGAEFQVNSYTTDAHGSPTVAMRPSGEFVVAWQRVQQGDRFGRVFARLFDASGNALGSEFQVEASATNTQRTPALAIDDTGRFVVVWQEYASGGLSDVRARRFDAFGTALGADFAVNAHTTDHQGGARIAVDGAGNFVVVWESYELSPGGGVVNRTCCFARRFDASDTPSVPDFPVTDRTSVSALPRVAMGRHGTFMVVWQNTTCCEDDMTGGINARLFDASGVPVGPEMQVDTPGPLVPPDVGVNADQPSVAADDAGTFVVAWHRSFLRHPDAHSFGWYDHHIQTRRYDTSGNPLEPGSAANTFWHPSLVKRNPAVAARKAGWFVVAWNGVSQNRNDVFARSPDVIFSDGFETRDLSSWSLNATDSGDGRVSSAARMATPGPAYGLQVLVNDRAGVFVQDDSPAAESRYRARLHLDPNGFDPGESVGRFRQRVFLAFSDAPSKRLVVVVLRRIGGRYAIAAHVRQDDETLARTGFTAITDGPHAVEFDWQQATAPGAHDGRFELWIDGTSVATLTALDNDERSVDFVRMGALSVKAGASGTLFFDEFVSRRLAYVGP